MLFRNRNLNYSHICSGWTFLPLLYIKGNSVAFIEGFETVCIDCWMMNKHIRSVFLLNEFEPFSIVKPLNSSFRHWDTLLSRNFLMVSHLGIAPFQMNLSFETKPAPKLRTDVFIKYSAWSVRHTYLRRVYRVPSRKALSPNPDPWHIGLSSRNFLISRILWASYLFADPGAQMVDMVVTDVAGKPTQYSRQFVKWTAFHGGSQWLPLAFASPIPPLKLMLHVKQPDSHRPCKT